MILIKLFFFQSPTPEPAAETQPEPESETESEPNVAPIIFKEHSLPTPPPMRKVAPPPLPKAAPPVPPLPREYTDMVNSYDVHYVNTANKLTN